MQQLERLGSDNSVTGAIALALVGAAIAAIGWVSVKIWDSARNSCIRRKKRREALTHLFVDALNQYNNLKRHFSEGEREKNIKLVKAADNGFRAYVENYDERDISKDISPYIAGLSEKEIAAISTYLELRGLFKQYYGKLATDQFAALSNTRKASVFGHLFDQARVLEDCSKQLIKIMKSRHKFLKKLNKEHKTFMEAMHAKRSLTDRSKLEAPTPETVQL